MSLADSLAAPAPAATCPIRDLLDSLPERDAAALRASLEPRVRRAKHLYDILRREGLIVGLADLEAHKATVARARGIPAKTPGCSCTDL